MELSAIKRRTTADAVFQILHDRIVRGELRHGDKLPPQDRLAEGLAVSRNTLREAIHKLTVMGLVSAKPGVGTVVKVASSASYVSSLGDHLLINSSTVAEFMEARLFIEKATVRLAVLKAKSADLKKLRSIVGQQRKAFSAGDLEGFSSLDAEFHLELAKLSRNQVMVKLLVTIWDLLRKFIFEVAQLPSAVENAIGFHSQIIELISRRDLEGAELRMVQHLRDVVQTIQKNMGTDLGVKPLFDMEKRSIKRKQ